MHALQSRPCRLSPAPSRLPVRPARQSRLLTTSSARVAVLDGKQSYDALVQKEKFAVVDHYTQWCGPCKMIAPKLEELAAELPDVTFAKVDLTGSALGVQLGVKAVPTFIAYKDGAEVARYSGAKLPELRAWVEGLRQQQVPT